MTKPVSVGLGAWWFSTLGAKGRNYFFSPCSFNVLAGCLFPCCLVPCSLLLGAGPVMWPSTFSALGFSLVAFGRRREDAGTDCLAGRGGYLECDVSASTSEDGYLVSTNGVNSVEHSG